MFHSALPSPQYIISLFGDLPGFGDSQCVALCAAVAKAFSDAEGHTSVSMGRGYLERRTHIISASPAAVESYRELVQFLLGLGGSSGHATVQRAADGRERPEGFGGLGLRDREAPQPPPDDGRVRQSVQAALGGALEKGKEKEAIDALRAAKQVHTQAHEPGTPAEVARYLREAEEVLLADASACFVPIPDRAALASWLEHTPMAHSRVSMMRASREVYHAACLAGETDAARRCVRLVHAEDWLGAAHHPRVTASVGVGAAAAAPADEGTEELGWASLRMGGGAPRDADARQADTYVASYGSRHACDGMALVAQYGLGGYHLSARKYKESAAAMCKLLWLPDCAYALFKHLHAAYGDAMLQGVPPDLLYAAGGELQTPVVAQLCHVEQRVADKTMTATAGAAAITALGVPMNPATVVRRSQDPSVRTNETVAVLAAVRPHLARSIVSGEPPITPPPLPGTPLPGTALEPLHGLPEGPELVDIMGEFEECLHWPTSANAERAMRPGAPARMQCISRLLDPSGGGTHVVVSASWLDALRAWVEGGCQPDAAPRFSAHQPPPLVLRSTPEGQLPLLVPSATPAALQVFGDPAPANLWPMYEGVKGNPFSMSAAPLPLRAELVAASGVVSAQLDCRVPMGQPTSHAARAVAGALLKLADGTPLDQLLRLGRLACADPSPLLLCNLEARLSVRAPGEGGAQPTVLSSFKSGGQCEPSTLLPFFCREQSLRAETTPGLRELSVLPAGSYLHVRVEVLPLDQRSAGVPDLVHAHLLAANPQAAAASAEEARQQAAARQQEAVSARAEQLGPAQPGAAGQQQLQQQQQQQQLEPLTLLRDHAAWPAELERLRRAGADHLSADDPARLSPHMLPLLRSLQACCADQRRKAKAANVERVHGSVANSIAAATSFLHTAVRRGRGASTSLPSIKSVLDSGQQPPLVGEPDPLAGLGSRGKKRPGDLAAAAAAGGASGSGAGDTGRLFWYQDTQAGGHKAWDSKAGYTGAAYWVCVERILRDCGLSPKTKPPGPYTGAADGLTTAQLAWLLAEVLAAAVVGQLSLPLRSILTGSVALSPRAD